MGPPRQPHLRLRPSRWPLPAWDTSPISSPSPECSRHFRKSTFTERSPAISGISMSILAIAYIKDRRLRCWKSRNSSRGCWSAGGDHPDPAKHIARLQNEVAREQATYAAVHANYVRLKQASDQQPGLVAAQELDDALAKDKTAAAQVDAAKSAVAAAQGQLGVSRAENLRVTSMEQYATITAPYNGVVTMRYADTGALIPAGTAEGLNQAVVRLAQSDVLRLRMPVPERDVPTRACRLASHGPCAGDGQQFPERWCVYTRDVSNSTRTMLTEVDVNNPDLTLTPGMYADVTFNLEAEKRCAHCSRKRHHPRRSAFGDACR